MKEASAELHDHHKTGVAATNVSAWAGRDAGAARSRRHGAGIRRSTAAAAPVRRLGVVYIPMGSNIAEWMPKQEGTLTELSPTLSPLMPFLKHVNVLSNLEMKNAYSSGNHATANCTFLSGVKAKMTEGSDYEMGITVDQIAAQQLGKDTALPSLELATDFNYVVGNCDNGFNCVYMNTLAWSSKTTPLPTEANPRVVFERLFGDGGSAADRKAELRKNGSILDWVTEDMARLGAPPGAVGSHARRRVSRYGARGRAAHSEGRAAGRRGAALRC